MTLSADIILDLLFHRTFAGWAAVGALACLLSMWRARTTAWRAVSCVLFWILAFTVSDVLGYDRVVLTNGAYQALTTRDATLVPSYQVSLNAYRIIQVSLQVILTALVLFVGSWRAAVSANVIWWTGGCDLLYHVFARKPLPSAWDWLAWSPAGLFADILPLWMVVVQSLTGVALAAAMLTWNGRRRRNAG